MKLKYYLLFLLLLGTQLQAANWYVKPAKSGTGSGADWNNAWALNGVAWGSVKGGDTVWMAGGKYSSAISPGSSGTASAAITIARVRSTDSVPAQSPGWNASFDSQAVIGGIYIPTQSHISVDGRSEYGFLINIGMGGGNGIELGQTGHSSSDLKMAYIDILGPYGSPSKPTGSEVVGWKISPSTGTLSDLTFDHCRTRGVGLGLHCLANNVTIQYCLIGDVRSDDGTEHPDVMYCYPSPNMIWRYNEVFNCDVDGIFFEYGGAVNFQFYGNVVYNTHNHQLYFKDGSTYGPIFVYNNVFAAPSAGDYGYCHILSAASGSIVRNNVFYNVSNDLRTTSDHNAYFPATLNGYGWPKETGSFLLAGNPFVNVTAGDVHQIANSGLKGKGPALTPLDGWINKDPDGVTRAGSWDIGVYQNAASVPTPTPSPTATPTPRPTATPSPSPTATPSPSPSTKFKIGDTVTGVDVINIRSLPAGAQIGSQPIGFKGVIAGGPVAAKLGATMVNWWTVNAATGMSGWMGEDDLEKIVPVPTPTPTPTPTPAPPATYNDWLGKFKAQAVLGSTPDQLLIWINTNPPTPD